MMEWCLNESLIKTDNSWMMAIHFYEIKNPR